MNPLKFKLVATPLSHYARKVRILLDSYAAAYEIVDITGSNIALTSSPDQVGNNPLMKVPVLQHGDDWLIESDHIASYLVSHLDKQDRYNVNSRAIFDLNSRAMLNGIMNEELKVIVARRHEVPTENYTYFIKAQNAVSNGLQWLESNHTKFNTRDPKYGEFHLVCCWDHLKYYDFVPGMGEKFPQLSNIVQEVYESASAETISRSAPHVLVPKVQI